VVSELAGPCGQMVPSTMSDGFTPLFGDRRGSVGRNSLSGEVLRWWAKYALEAPRLARWLDDAFEDGFEELEGVGVNAVDWWLDAFRIQPQARRRYRLDSNSELEWLLLHWPRQLRFSNRPTSVAGRLAEKPSWLTGRADERLGCGCAQRCVLGLLGDVADRFRR